MVGFDADEPHGTIRNKNHSHNNKSKSFVEGEVSPSAIQIPISKP